MARPLRIECQNGFHHVLSRGIERRAIFVDDRDRGHFLELLGTMAERFEVEVLAYVLMENHYHLVVRTVRANLSRAAHWLGAAYVNWFNARHGRAGHLFAGRFKAFLVEDEDYLRRLVLYVHRNPLRAGLVARLADYPWSSYRSLAYGRGGTAWLQRDQVLALFGGGAPGFRQAVQDYSEESAKLLEDLWHGFFLGSEAGFRRLVAERLRALPDPEKPQWRAALRSARAPSVEALVRNLAEAVGLAAAEVEELRRPKRHVRRPWRDILIYLAWREGDFRLSDIGRYFRIGYTSVAHARRRGQAHAELNRRLRAALRRAGIVNNS